MLGRLGLLRRAYNQFKLAARLLREPQVPLALKGLLVAAAGYVVLPLDVLPDVVPGLGQLDDLTVALLAMQSVISLVPRRLVDHHRSHIREHRRYTQAPEPAGAAAQDTVIDAEFRRH